jgi:hypothetical protein
MKRFTLALIAVVFLSAGTASADRGFWYGAGEATDPNWLTIFNIVNYGASDASITVTFYNMANSLIGSTVQTITGNETWNFSTASVVSISASSFDPVAGALRGSVNITSDQGKNVAGYTTIFNALNTAGFNFRIVDLVENP